MTEITPSFIYWITRLDEINFLLGAILILSIIGLVVFLIFTIATASNQEDELYGMFKKYFLISTYIFIPIAILLIFTPTTKEACAMYVIPKIVNNEKIQNIGQEFYDVALDWMKELHSNKCLKNKETSK